MKTIVILSGRYLPGYKDGGPVRTLINLTDCLGKEYRFKIITNDRDHGDQEAYKNIKYDEPNQIENAEVWYVKPNGFTLSLIQKVTVDADLIYICGPYDDYAYKTLLLKRLGKIKKPVVVASMGSFSQGAFQIRAKKKKMFISICKMLGLFKSIAWSVTSKLEEIDVKRIISKEVKCMIAEDLPRKVDNIEIKIKKDFSIVFISRICEMKNLLYAVNVLAHVKSNVKFDVYGTLEDTVYWEKCKCALSKLPSNISWQYCGIAEPQKVINIFSNYDVFLFPTRGENYGHVVFEAMAGGCIPVISDQTPWNEIEQYGCGKVYALNEKLKFSMEIDELAGLNVDKLTNMKIKAHEFAKIKYEQSITHTGYREIFR